MSADRTTPILIVDDNPHTVQIMRTILTALGFTHLEEARSGQEALPMIQGGAFGLVLSDWHMKPMSGLDLLKTVRAEARTQDLPFVLVTAETGHLRVDEAVLARASRYLIKPFTLASLKAVLVALLGEL